MRTTHRGYTLWELLITLAIAGILGGLALPSLQEALQRGQTRAVLQDWFHAIQYARTAALSHANQHITLCGSPDGKRCDRDWSQGWILFDDRNRNRQWDADETLHRSNDQPLKRHRLQWAASGNRPYLRFAPDGSAREFGSLTLCPLDGNNRHARIIIINMPGRPRLARDRDGDGIVEDSNGKSVQC